MRSRVIAVAGAKGAPGVSFVAAALACRLAAFGLATLAMDADDEDHALGVLLDARDLERSEPVASESIGMLTGEALRAEAIEVASNLRLLVPVTGGDAAPDGRTVAGAARDAGFAAVVCDLGHRHGALQKQLAAAADWLLWVVEPDRLGLDRADRLLSAPVLRAASAGLVFNRVGPHGLRGAERALSDRHELPLMAAVREDRRAAARCTAERPWHAQRPFRGPLDDLARTLHPDLPKARRGSWP